MFKIIKFLLRRTYGNFLEQIHKKEIKNLSDGECLLNYNIPSFTQWESRNLVDGILKGEIDTKDDPLWQESGAQSKEEYEMYGWQICGMTCLKMILKSIYRERDYRLVELAKDAEKY